MPSKIVISAVCYACHHRDLAIKIDKPNGILARSFDNDCPKCKSINTYRVSRRGGNVKVETIWCRATKEGQDIYKERTGEEFTHRPEQD